MTNAEPLRVRRLKCFLSDKESEATIRSLRFNELNITPEYYQGDISFAITHIKENRSPDILIVDISKSKMPISDMKALAEICEPGVEVIVVGEKNDVGIFRDLVLAGVRDYFVKPIPHEQLLKSLMGICGLDKIEDKATQFNKSGKVIGVIGASGGAGVSTLVANLGWDLAETHAKRVSIIDLDLQLGSISQFLDLDPSIGFAQLFESPDRIDQVLIDRYMTYYGSNLGVLSAQVGIHEKPVFKAKAIDAVMNILSSQFHYSLVDLPRNFTNDINFQVFEKAKCVIIVTDYSLTGLRDTKRYIEVLKNYPSLKQGVVIVANKVGLYSQGEINRQAFEEAIQRQITFEIPFDKTHAMKSLTQGTPVVAANSGPLVGGIEQLTGYLLGAPMVKKSASSIFGDLKSMISATLSGKSS